MINIEKLRALIAREIEKMNFNSRHPQELYMPVDYIMSMGGKRLRPVLCLMACRLFTDDIFDCLRPAVAIELFHNFTLLHDDIMDKADMRRGRPTVHKKWGENTAIISGDVMVVLSFDLISSAKPDILPRLLSVFNRTAVEVCEGQQMDMNFETISRVDENSYLEMIKLKTSVLIAASMEIGAIAAGASTKDSGLMYESGLNLGLAFQLQDDVMDLYGDQDKFGKKPGGDILMNKKTILLIKAFETADEKTANKITDIMEKEQDPETKISEIKNIFDQLDVKEAADRMTNDYFQEALRKLNGASCNPERKKEFGEFIETVMNRKS